MSNIDNDNSIESVAAGRLAAPGVVDREPVLRRYDRLQHPLPTSALTDRLHQRAAHAQQADAGALVWQRTSIVANAFLPEPPPSADVGHATTPSVQRTPAQRVVSAAAVGTTAAPKLVQRSAQPQPTPGTVDSIAQAVSGSPAIAKDTQSTQVQARYGVETAASVSAGRTATPLVASSAPVAIMRQADSTIARRPEQTPLASIAKRSSNPPRADLAAPPPSTRATSLPISVARKRDASAAPSSSMPADTLRSVARSTDATSTIATALSTPVIALAPSSPSATTPLVLRRVAAPVPASPSSPPVPYSIPSSSAVAEELTRAAQAGGTASAPHAATVASASAHAGNPDVDRLAAEIERRLRLRLEIERERRGIRSWR